MTSLHDLLEIQSKRIKRLRWILEGTQDRLNFESVLPTIRNWIEKELEMDSTIGQSLKFPMGEP